MHNPRKVPGNGARITASTKRLAAAAPKSSTRARTRRTAGTGHAEEAPRRSRTARQGEARLEQHPYYYPRGDHRAQLPVMMKVDPARLLQQVADPAGGAHWGACVGPRRGAGAAVPSSPAPACPAPALTGCCGCRQHEGHVLVEADELRRLRDDRQDLAVEGPGGSATARPARRCQMYCFMMIVREGHLQLARHLHRDAGAFELRGSGRSTA